MLFALVGAIQAADAKSGADASEPQTLRLEIEVPADIASVWKAFSTAEGLQSWMAPVVHIDLKIGGIMESSYNPAAKMGDPANIKNRILSYAPESMISMQIAQFPPNYRFNKTMAASLWNVFLFERIGENKTRVILLGLGFQEGEEWNGFRKMAAVTNQYALNLLKQRFEKGPVDWEAMLKAARNPKQ